MIQQFPTLAKISKTVLSFSKVTEYVQSFPKIVKDSPRVSKENTNYSSHDMQQYCRNTLVEIESIYLWSLVCEDLSVTWLCDSDLRIGLYT